MGTKNSKEKQNKENWFWKSTRVVGLNPVSFQERWRFTFNRLQLISVFVLLAFVFFFIYYAVFAYTPMGYWLPENVKNRNKEQIERQFTTISKLEDKVQKQDQFIANLQLVITGEIPLDSVYQTSSESTSPQESKVDTSISSVERELTEHLQKREETQKNTPLQSMEDLFLFDPVKGEISQEFRLPNHAGVDIVTAPKEKIRACLDGVVIHSSFDDADGHMIILSHRNDIISVYKHAERALVKTGDRVEAGNGIGIVGNSGERTSGPHLHFELWTAKGPLNPLNYLSFGQ